ncbi:TPA: hypothetical protein JG832_002413 [Enterobacter hormaechei subsp. xiangfangensis]|nr:hypothetical protein [Enterobacter hormaechei subsp. xiangfangensis]HAV1890550.1 hypothetical protein [Enterobacter hormaechei subsp. xiangfangensis]
MARHKDDQLRIRFARLTATSSACKRFVQQHDKLTGAARIERHIDVVRMGQMALEMGMVKALAFIDNEAFASLTPVQRLERLLDALRMDEKLPASYVQSSEVVEVPVLRSIEDVPTPPAAPQEPQKPEPAQQQPDPENAPKTPEVKPAKGHQQDVTQTEDGATFISQPAAKITAKIKGLGDGA